MIPFRTRFASLSCVLALLLPNAAMAEPIEIVDLAGRTVVLDRPAEQVLLGEGRFLVAISLLTPEAPLGRVAGVLNEFRRYDPAGFDRYADAFPGLSSLPIFGQTTEESVSVETALSLRPDAAIFGRSGHGPQADSQAILDVLAAADIPVVFVDFRDDPLGNTAESMRVIGRTLGLETEGEAFASYYEEQVSRVTDRMAAWPGPRPRVLLEVRVGLGDGCCFTIARGMFDSLIAAAGGDNIARDRLPGATGVLNLEYVIDADPDVYLGTAIGVAEDTPDAGGRIALGAGVSEDGARASLAATLQRPGIATLSAVQEQRAYAIWHHFYNSPLNVYAVQRLAVWLHPDLFPDLDPEQTLHDLLSRVQPVDLSGTYAIGIEDGE